MPRLPDASHLLKKTGYCPYCGGDLIPAILDPNTGWLEWDNCKKELCRATAIRITTDAHGFVLFPRDIEGQYIYKRPSGRKNATRRLR